jgi:hypothetical protein
LAFLRLRLGQTAPRDLGVGEDHGGNRVRFERDLVARDHLGGDAALVRRLVRQHGVAHHVADGEDAGFVGASLRVDFDEAAFVHALRFLEANPVELFLADRHQHPVCNRLFHRART